MILIIGDEIDEADEELSMTLSNPIGAVLAPGAAQVLGVILDDDETGEPPPDDALRLFLPAFFR